MTSLNVEQLVRLVEGHVAIDPREELSLQIFRQEVIVLTDPCNEHANITHVTASGIVASAMGTVLHLHKRLNIWLQPGGHIDSGEHPSEAALREAQEETGLHVRHPTGGPLFFHLDVHPGPRGHTHLDLRYLLLGDPEETPAPGVDESQQVQWFAWGEALRIADPGLVGALQKAEELIAQH